MAYCGLRIADCGLDCGLESAFRIPHSAMTCGASAWTSIGTSHRARTDSARRRSASSTAPNSGTPDGTRKHLNPRTPASTSASSSPALSGTTPPQNPTSTCTRPRAAARFASSAATVVVAGTLLSGMSTIAVTPPAAAARVAVSKPSQSVRPGSLTCTCVSTRPGDTTRSPKSISSAYRSAKAFAPRSSGLALLSSAFALRSSAFALRSS